MARLARTKPVEVEASDDELPELSTLLKGTTRKGAKATDRTTRLEPTTTSPRRSSPRRRGTATTSARRSAGRPVEVSNDLDLSKDLSAINLSASKIALPPPISPVKRSAVKGSSAKMNAGTSVDWQLSPIKRSAVLAQENERESGAATSMQQQQRPLKLAHVNSLLLPLSRVALGAGGTGEEPDVELVLSSRGDGGVTVDAEMKQAGRVVLRPPVIEKPGSNFNFDSQDMEKEKALNGRRASPKRAAKERANDLSRFVLKEARCNDTSDDSSDENDDDDDDDAESTDLSGFIVDDDAELSIHDSDSDGNSDFNSGAQTPRRKEPFRKRRLQHRRSEARASMENEEDDNVAQKENRDIGDVAQGLFSLKLNARTNKGRGAEEIEVIDLTYSPPKAQPGLKAKSTTKSKEVPSSHPDPFQASGNDDLPKFSPPRSKSPAKLPLRWSNSAATTANPVLKPTDSKQDNRLYTTPPTTPPASPNKLKSPSKLHLLSPSKRGAAIPTSPHRQSIDAFWSSDVINTWNDQYSPRKPPLTVSPQKSGLARLLEFDIWTDSDDEDAGASQDGKNDTSSPSDPLTPTRSSSSSNKMPKSPSKVSSPSKKALAQSKELFLSTRHATAQSLFNHLDKYITSGKLSALSASTGGVQILWSKNLRSTAGRANWRRTVTKPPSGRPGGPMKSTAASRSSNSALVEGVDVTEGKPLIQHYASIELAEKVIDSDSRLVNTLTHEFCHLANFMVSGVRDQPHGASFKAWANKVTTHLRTTPHLPELYRAVEVTTKHSYVISHKYIWICAGNAPLGSAQAAARAFLALDDDPGCGAEYGRHSKSIDPEKYRCGKCKGLLVQVRPKPKAKVGRAEPDGEGESPRKGRRASETKQRIGTDGRFGENIDESDGRSNGKLGGLEQALEYVDLSD
jgi:predicted SprT family Zn-dependent metalloprotease